MAAKTFYMLSSTAITPNFFGNLQENGSAPSAANAAFGWTPGSSAVAFWRARLGAASADTANQASSFIDSTSGPTKGTGATNTTAGDSFISPVAYIGTFADAAWSFTFDVRCTTTGAIGRIRMRVWASVNADGSSARELTSGTQVGSTITLNALTTDFSSLISWSPGVITLSNEFLFFQIEWNVTSAGATSSNVLIRRGPSQIITPDFEGTQTSSFANLYTQATTAWVPGPTAPFTAAQLFVGVKVDNPPPGNAPEVPSLIASVRSWEPDPYLYEFFGANGPFKVRQLPPKLIDVVVNNPPANTVQGRLTLSASVGSWEPDPSLYEFFGANAPFDTRQLAPPVISLVINNPPITAIRIQEQVNGTWQPDPAAFQFLGGRGPFLPPRIPASLLAVPVNAPPIVLPQTERPYDNWWIPSDPLPQFHPIIPQGPPNPSFGYPAPSTWTILSAWNPPDAQAPIAGKINPVFLAIAVNNPPVSSNADNQLVAGGYWPALPDPNPTLPPLIPAAILTIQPVPPVPSSNADNQLAAGGYWPALPDPNPTLRPPLPVSITAVTVSNPPPSPSADNQLAAGGYWPTTAPSFLFQTQIATGVRVDNPPISSTADNQLAAGGTWPALPDPLPTLPRYLIPLLIGPPRWNAVALYETIFQSWAPPDPQVLPPRLNPALRAVTVNNPPIAGLNGDNQLAAGGYWPALPDPLPVLRPKLPVSVTGTQVNNPPTINLEGYNQLAAGGYWPALPYPNPTLLRYLPIATTGSPVNAPPPTQSAGANQLAAGGYWPSTAPSFLFQPQITSGGRVDNPPLGVFSTSPDQLGAVISLAWEAAKVTLLFGQQTIIGAPAAQVNNPPPFSYVRPYATILNAWEPPPPPLVAISTPPVTVPAAPPPSGQPFGNSAYLQVFATFGPVATSLTWLQLPPALLDTSVSNPSFGGAPDATQAILAAWQPADPAPIIPRLLPQPFVPVVQLISEVTPLETIITSWQPPDLPQQKVKRRFFLTAGTPVPPVAPSELVEIRENWRVDRASWPVDTPTPVVARPLNPAISNVPVNNPPQRRADQAGIAASWVPTDPPILRSTRLSPSGISVPPSNPPFRGGAPANLAGVLSGAWIIPDALPQRSIAPRPGIVIPSFLGQAAQARLLAALYATWIAPDVLAPPRVFIPQPGPAFIPLAPSQTSLLSVLGAWVEPPPALPKTTPQVSGAVFLPSPAPPSPLETILSSWVLADLPPTLARQQVPPTQIGGQNARTSGQTATVLAAWQDTPQLPVTLRYLPTGVTAVVVSPPVLTGQYLDNLITVLSFWVPSSFDQWFTAIPFGQPLPPPVPPIPHGTAVFEALGSPHELGSTLRAGLGALSRS